MDKLYIPIVIGTLLFAVMVAFFILFVILFRKTQYRFELERQQLKQAKMESEVEIQEQTMTEISRDLHDNFGQIASLIKINLGMLKTPEKLEDAKRLADTQELMKGLIADIRSLSATLNSDNIVRQGITELMQKDVDRIFRTGFVEVEFGHENYSYALNQDKAIILYRMFQEMLNNILKHSEAKKVEVELSNTKNQITLSVKDDGKGIDLDKIQRGSGLNNILDRCKLIKAKNNIVSVLGKGTQIEIILPIEES